MGILIKKLAMLLLCRMGFFFLFPAYLESITIETSHFLVINHVGEPSPSTGRRLLVHSSFFFNVLFQGFKINTSLLVLFCRREAYIFLNRVSTGARACSVSIGGIDRIVIAWSLAVERMYINKYAIVKGVGVAIEIRRPPFVHRILQRKETVCVSVICLLHVFYFFSKIKYQQTSVELLGIEA